MKILYISTVCTPKVLDYIFETSTIKPCQAVQKFHRLLLEGFATHSNECMIDVLSVPPVSTQSNKRVWWKIKPDKFKGIWFKYVPFINLPFLKYPIVFVWTFFYVLKWRFINRGLRKVIICDILNPTLTWSAFFVGKLTNQPLAVIVTDLPIYMISTNGEISFAKKIYLMITNFILHRFDYYIGLTEQMKEVINPFQKPFLVMEGIVDKDLRFQVLPLKNEFKKKTIIYAGGINDDYGIKQLIEAFSLIKIEDIELHIYGTGNLKNEMHKFEKLDNRLKYYGVVKNSIIVKCLQEATLLINPRLTHQDFTKFSFPSKNMEFMVSGTPLITTRLPGMPIEYYNYVYLIEDETVAGIRLILESVISKSNQELNNFGLKAKNFVLENKSNVMQVKRILTFLDT